MSGEAVNWARDLPGLNRRQRAVLINLASRANKLRGFQAYPSIGRIAADTGYSERSVSLALSELEALGLIKRTRHGRRPCTYLIRPHQSGASDLQGMQLGPNADTQREAGPTCKAGVFNLKTAAPPIEKQEEKQKEERKGSSGNDFKDESKSRQPITRNPLQRSKPRATIVLEAESALIAPLDTDAAAYDEDLHRWIRARNRRFDDPMNLHHYDKDEEWRAMSPEQKHELDGTRSRFEESLR